MKDTSLYTIKEVPPSYFSSLVVNNEGPKESLQTNICEVLLNARAFPLHYAYECFAHLYLEHTLSPNSLYSQFTHQQNHILWNSYNQLRPYVNPTVIEIGCANGYKTWKLMHSWYSIFSMQQHSSNTNIQREIFQTISSAWAGTATNTLGSWTKPQFIENYFGLDYSSRMIALATSNILELEFIPYKYLGNESIFGWSFQQMLQSVGAKTYMLLGLTLANMTGLTPDKVTTRTKFLDNLYAQMNSGDTVLLDLPTHPDTYDNTYRNFINKVYQTEQATEFDLQTMESL